MIQFALGIFHRIRFLTSAHATPSKLLFGSPPHRCGDLRRRRHSSFGLGLVASVSAGAPHDAHGIPWWRCVMSEAQVQCIRALLVSYN